MLFYSQTPIWISMKPVLYLGYSLNKILAKGIWGLHCRSQDNWGQTLFNQPRLVFWKTRDEFIVGYDVNNLQHWLIPTSIINNRSMHCLLEDCVIWNHLKFLLKYSVNEMQGISRISQHFSNIEPNQEQLQAVSSYYVSGKDTVVIWQVTDSFISLGLATM